MKIIKNIVIIGFLIISSNGILIAQTILQSENFESYTAGEYVVYDDTTSLWATFNENGGANEDVLVVDDTATSGVNAIHIEQYKNVVYKLGENTEGRYELKFNTYVNKWGLGFFRIAQKFPTDTVKTGLEFYYDRDGKGFFYANNNTYKFNYENDKWLSVKVIIDIDDDFGTLFIDENEIAFFNWEGGSNGLSEASSIEGLHFFGVSYPGAYSNMLVDDISFSKVESVDAITNFTATLTNNNVDLSWDAPTSFEASYYLIFRNGIFIDTVFNELVYKDSNLHPSIYTYSVRANTADKGYSLISEESSVNIEGGVDRINTLFEIFTGTWCGYCPGAALAADDLIHNGDNVAIIEYHYSDAYQVDHGFWRQTKYYNVHSFPTALVDGGQQLSWGNPTESVYPIYKPMHDKAKVKPALHNITLNVTKSVDNIYTVNVTVEEIYKYFNNLKLQVALTESHIEEEWLGLSELNFVLRRMYPNAQGTTLDFTTNNTIGKTFEIELDENSIAANSEIVVFVQDSETQEVSQVVKLNLTDPSVGINRDFNSSINLYPNPASDFVQVTSGNEIIKSIEIFNMNGSKVDSYNNISNSQNISISHFSNGLYLFKVQLNDGSIEFHKIIKE